MDTIKTNNQPFIVHTHARPKRIAFLHNVDLMTIDEVSQCVLFSANLWGGKYHAIIPFGANGISEDWWRLLCYTDPDIIVAFHEMPDELKGRIDRYICPYKIIFISAHDREHRQRHLLQSHDINAMGVNWIPSLLWSKRDSIRPSKFAYIHESGSSLDNQMFCLHNFGLLSDVVSTQNSYRNIEHAKISGDLPPKEALTKMLEHHPRLTTQIDLCSKLVSSRHPHVYNHELEGLKIIVGSSPLDIVCAWNCRIYGIYSDNNHVIWTSDEFLKDGEFVSKLDEWIQRTYWGDRHPWNVKFISYSISEDELKKISELFPKLKYHLKTVHKYETNKFPASAMENTSVTYYQQGWDRTQLISHSRENLLPLPWPKNLPELDDFHSPHEWMVDIAIEYHRPNHFYSSNPTWNLPKNRRYSGCFLGRGSQSRITSDGLLSVATSPGVQTASLKLPNPWELFASHLNPDFVKEDGSWKPVYPPFQHLQTSDCGKYLQGLISLFGGLDLSCQFFADPFWRTIFYKLSSYDPDADSERREQILRQGLDGISQQNIDDKIREMSRRLLFRDAPPTELTEKELRAEFGKISNSEEHQRYVRKGEKFGEFKLSELEALVEEKVLKQGLKLTCNFCKSSFWYHAEMVKSKISCMGCRKDFPLPISPEWSFRLNDLVVNAIRQHGTVSVLQALSEISHTSLGFFLYVPSQDIYEKYDSPNRITDIDLIAFTEKCLTIGEVKSSPEGFTEEVIATFEKVASVILPQKMIFATPTQKWPQDVLTLIESSKERMKLLGVEVQFSSLSWGH